MIQGKKSWLIVGGVVLVAILVLLWQRPWQDGENSDSVVRVGYLPIAASLPLFVAEDSGYFADEGLTVELIPFQSSNQLALAGASGEIDLMVTCALNAALETSRTTKKEFKVFLLNSYVDRSDDDANRSTDSLIAKKGVTIEDLKGQPVAFFPGSVTRVFAEIVLPKHGLEVAEIEYVEMAPPMWAPSLKSGNVKAVHAVEPFATLLVESGEYDVLIDGYCGQALQRVALSGAWFIDGRAGEETNEKLLRVFRRAVERIETEPSLARKSYKNFTEIPEGVYSKIGLNEWALTTDDAESVARAKEFLNLLIERDAVSGELKDMNWIYE